MKRMKILFDQEELRQRMERNFHRLQNDPYYQIGAVFSSEDYDWYGDKEGRALLAFVSHYKMSGRKIPCMEQMLEAMPEHTGKGCCFGTIDQEVIHEQQLSGHSWLLRGLCEHYEQFGDDFSLQTIRAIADTLYLPTLGRYRTYPLEREEKNVGGVGGNSLEAVNGWRLSTDIGCAFMSIDGLSHAYRVIRDENIRRLVDEMIEVYSGIDKAVFRAQTHCTLTAARGMMRMYEMTGEMAYLDSARDIWELYVNGGGMTWTYQNLNWWNRPDSWTEPCAVIDSLMLSLMLYQVEQDEKYRQTAARIYINGFASLQRDNGGAGTDTLICPGSGQDTLYAQLYEAEFCCTMRLAEGLWYIAQHQKLLWGERTQELIQNENGIYMCGDYIYAQISGGGENFAEETVFKEGYTLSPLLKYFRIPKEILVQTRQRVVFEKKTEIDDSFPFPNVVEMETENVRYDLKIDYYPPLADAGTIDLRPLADDKTVLRNPHKGWFWHYIDNGRERNTRYQSTTGGSIDPQDHLEDFPGLNHLYLRFDWCDVEKEEGQIDWTWIDQVMDEWGKYDYRFSLRICCYEANCVNPFTTPEYVFRAGAKGYALPGGRLQPDYGDPIFLEKLEAFLQKTGEKFNGDPRIELIDVGTIGTWGEGHTGYGEERVYPAEVIQKHLELHAKYFPDTYVVMNDDHINAGWQRGVEANEKLMEYARQMKFGLQDDSVCCEGYADYNGYDTLRTPWMFDMLWENAPIVLEFEHYHKVWENPDVFKDGLPFLEAMKNTHATYAGFHGFPRPWLERVPYLTEYCANRLGYWYFVDSLEIPKLQNGKENPIVLNIRNRGFGLCYQNYILRLTLKNTAGDSFTQDFAAHNNEWKPDQVVKVPLSFCPENLPVGEYELYLGLFEGDRPIELAIKPERRLEGMYHLCNVKLRNG